MAKQHVNIKDHEERNPLTGEYLALRKRLKERKMEARGYIIDRRRGLQEMFGSVVASNQKMSKDIIKGLAPITEGLQEEQAETASWLWSFRRSI